MSWTRSHWLDENRRFSLQTNEASDIHPFLCGGTVFYTSDSKPTRSFSVSPSETPSSLRASPRSSTFFQPQTTSSNTDKMTSSPPAGEYRSTFTSRSPSSTLLPALAQTQPPSSPTEQSPLLLHLDRSLSRSRSRGPRGTGVESAIGDEEDDEVPEEEESAASGGGGSVGGNRWWKGGGRGGSGGVEGGRGERTKKRLNTLKTRSRY